MLKRRSSEVDQAESQMVERLWLVCLSKWTKQDRASNLIDEREDMVAVVASNHSNTPADPLEQKFKSSGVYIRGRSGWLVDRIVVQTRPGRKAIRLLHKTLDEKLAKYARRNWLTSDGHIEKALRVRGVVEHIKVDLAMLCGFNRWLQKYSPEVTDDPQEMDLSKILGFQMRRKLKVTVSNFDFPSRDRLALVSDLPPRVQRVLQKLSPAGELAYHSMTLAMKKAIEKQQEQAESDPEGAPDNGDD